MHSDLARPETVWPVDDEYAEDYKRTVALGRRIASSVSACVVGIARNAMPRLLNTVNLIQEVRAGFADCRVFVFENDSDDGTDLVLDRWAQASGGITVRHEALGGMDARGGFDDERTSRLAYCRNKCHEWVKEHASGTSWTIVLDFDPQHGFSVDGVFHSIATLATLALSASPGGAASLSLYRKTDEDGKPSVAQYDSWAARPLCWWRDRKDECGFGWFSLFLPPVGSPPMPMNSAFGGLCVYSTRAFMAAGDAPYEGGDCEHVSLHRKMKQAGYQLYLNPGCRYISIWE